MEGFIRHKMVYMVASVKLYMLKMKIILTCVNDAKDAPINSNDTLQIPLSISVESWYW